MFTIGKKFRFEGAHILTSSHTKECQKVHGHSYEVEFIFESRLLNDDGMVVDFGLVSEFIKPNYIDCWDHRLIVQETNPFLREIPLSADESMGILRTTFNPTAENMARYLFKAVKLRFPQLSMVSVRETKTGWAGYDEDD